MYYIIYKTTNLITNKFYIGYHKTIDLNDSYLGSGKILKKAISKYGENNFSKEILYIFPTLEEALLKEMEIVNQEFVSRKDTYNIKIGGDGGWDYVNNYLLKDPKYIELFRERISSGVKKAIKEGKMDESFRKAAIRIIQQNKLFPPFLNKNHSEKTKKLISENNGSALSQEEILRRLTILQEIQFGYGWKSKVAKKWGIPHQNVKKFLDKYLIGAKIQFQYYAGFENYKGEIPKNIQYGEVLGYTLSENFENLLLLKVGIIYYDGRERILDSEHLIGIKENIIKFI